MGEIFKQVKKSSQESNPEETKTTGGKTPVKGAKKVSK